MRTLPTVITAFANNDQDVYLPKLKAESDALQDMLKSRYDVRHVPLDAARTDNLLDHLKTYKDSLQVLHLGAHTNEHLIRLNDQEGWAEGLAEVLAKYDELKLIFVNGCKSQAQARAYLKEGIPAVIATTCPVPDGQAAEFATDFYKFLVSNYTLEDAFKEAIGRQRFRRRHANLSSVFVARGLDLDSDGPQDHQLWCLYLQEEKKHQTCKWRLGHTERIPRVFDYYEALQAAPPNGAKVLSQCFHKEHQPSKYIHYLSDNVLPYFSLDAFYARKSAALLPFSERWIIEQLLDHDQYEGAIIIGKGGIGKTRMMLQLGMIAHEKEWNVIVLNRHFERSNLRQLGIYLSQLEYKKHFILIDQFENCVWFDDQFLDDLAAYCPGTEEMRFLTNCRSSYQFLGYSYYLKINLDEHTAQSDYEKWVVRNLLRELVAPTSFTRYSGIKTASFAVFLGYMKQKEPTADNLVGFPDFQSWLLHHFIQMVDPTRNQIQQFDKEVNWLLSFPLQEGEKDEYLRDGSAFKSCLNKLIKDGWVEENQQQNFNIWRISQNTIIDELAMVYFQGYADVRIELNNSFEYAIAQGRGKNWINNIQRIRNEIARIGGEAVFFRLFQGILPKHTHLAQVIFSSQLLTKEEVLLLMEQYPDIAEAVLQDNDAILPLSFAMNQWAKDQVAAGPEFQKLINRWMDVHAPSQLNSGILARFTSTYLKLIGLDEKIKPYVDHFWSLDVIPDGSFVLQEYIERCSSIDPSVKVYFERYLERYSRKEGVEHLIKLWLTHQGERTYVENLLPMVIQNHTAKKGTRHLVFSWLDAGGDKKLVARAFRQYTDSIIDEVEFPFVIESWLQKTRDVLPVQNAIQQYLEKHRAEKESAYMLRDWLKYGKNPGLCAPFVEEYLETHAQEKEAHLVLMEWLEIKGDFDAIEQALLQHLKYQAHQEDSHFLIRSWLKQRKNLAEIEQVVAEYLKKYAQKSIICYIIASWLDRGGATVIVEPTVKIYLLKHNTYKGTSFLIESWIKAKGSLSLVQTAILQYAQYYPREKGTSLVLSAWLLARGNHDHVEEAVERYLKHHNGKIPSYHLLLTWLNTRGAPAVILPHLTMFVKRQAPSKEAKNLIEAWRKNGFDPFTLIE